MIAARSEIRPLQAVPKSCCGKSRCWNFPHSRNPGDKARRTQCRPSQPSLRATRPRPATGLSCGSRAGIPSGGAPTNGETFTKGAAPEFVARMRRSESPNRSQAPRSQIERELQLKACVTRRLGLPGRLMPTIADCSGDKCGKSFSRNSLIPWSSAVPRVPLAAHAAPRQRLRSPLPWERSQPPNPGDSVAETRWTHSLPGQSRARENYQDRESG